MSGLAGRLTAAATAQPATRSKPQHPKGYEPWLECDTANTPTAGAINVKTIPDSEQAWRDEIGRVFPNLPVPEHRQVELTALRYWGNAQEPMVYVAFKLTDRVTNPAGLPDLVALFKQAKVARKARVPLATETTDSATVVLWSDPQTGKVASRGGTPDLIDRIDNYLTQLDGYCKKQKTDTAYLLDCGDIIEGFENTSEQTTNNDLSLMDQVDLASSLLMEAVKRLAATHDRVVLAGVGSNHCRWRRGKDQLGFAGDDWGTHILKQINKALRMNTAYDHVTVRWPGKHEETLSLDVAGTIIGLAHGHQASRPELIPDWWAKQAHGGQPIAHADILVTGHYHALRVQPTGRSLHSNRSKWWIQAPTMDNGSDWYRYKAGSDSDPGLAVFTVTDQGWDNLKLLN